MANEDEKKEIKFGSQLIHPRFSIQILFIFRFRALFLFIFGRCFFFFPFSILDCVFCRSTSSAIKKEVFFQFTTAARAWAVS